MNSLDFLRNQNDNFCSIFIFHQNFWKYRSFQAHHSDFQPNLRKEVNNQNSGVRKFGFPVTAQVTKLI